MVRIYLTLFAALVMNQVTAQLQSPEQFLGYPIGTRYTPHFKIVQYFQYVAQQVSNQVKLDQYGVTNEGRPLYLATIASPGNLGNIEQIRTNNLRLANVLKDGITPLGNSPVIVWLGYNVHGNETSSSEAAMLTLFELANPTNQKSQEWLKNTVVIIDPCLNPDGRDRYVNWYTSVLGSKNNPQPYAREHREPWPGGRSNHYYFDLNRDWAWQSQVESRARVKKYNQWLPQVYVDFHEQGFNEPYYFAPAAEPYHEVITKWQRDFQVMIGKNHAKYFDQNGWLYFTKQRFDLFYPSYGDTYPIYSGSIGMTYEQGGIRAGLGIINEDGDTVTLRDRAIHHFTSGISTVEVSSLNADKLVGEFKAYYKNVINNPNGEFKSWLVKNDGTDRMDRLKLLLDRNEVEWTSANAGTISGLNYFSGRQEQVKSVTGDIVINANQPKGNFIKVLFERNSKMSDSITYDITAWSIPFAFGLKTYGISGYTIPGSKKDTPSGSVSLPDNAYAYAIKWTGLNSAKLLAILLQKGIKVRYAEQAFSTGVDSFEKGTLLVTKTSNAGKPYLKVLQDAAIETGTSVCAIGSGFMEKGFDLGSDRVRVINAPKVAMLTGDNISSLGAGELWHFFDQQLAYPLTLVSANEFFQGAMNQFNVLILADGVYDFFNKKEANEELKNWVRKGGKVIAIENAVAQMAKSDWGIKFKEDGEKKEAEVKSKTSGNLKRYENRERDEVVNSMPGAIYKLELDQSHPLGFGYPDYYYTLKMDSNIYAFLNEGGWNVGVIRKDNYISGFTGSKLKEKLKDGLLIGAQELGNGQVIYLAEDPIFRSFWENGKLLLCNAVFLAGQ